LASSDRKLTSNHFCRMAAQQSALDGLPKRQPMEAWPVRGLVPLDASTAERPAAFALTSWPVNPPNCQTGRDLTAEPQQPNRENRRNNAKPFHGPAQALKQPN
jgi:hypothetical protein